jgi:hypothetical protein
MVIAVSWDKADHRDITSPNGRRLTRTSFIEPAALAEKAWKVQAGGGGEPEDGPQAILAQYPTGEIISPHYHRTDQFQIVVEGAGRVGRSRYDPVSVQYTDGFTPYTIIPEPQGISFFVLRANADTGAYPMPQSKALKGERGGRGIVSRVITTPAEQAGVVQEPLLGPSGDGMCAVMLRAEAGASVQGSSPAESAGQFYVITRGNAEYNGESYPTWSVLWVGADDTPPALVAGAEGCDVVVTQFPLKDAAATPAMAGAAGAQR